MLVSAAMESIAQISMNVQAIISTLAMPMHLVQIMMEALLALAMTNSKEMVLTVPILTSLPTTPTIARRMDYVQIHSAALTASVTTDSVAMESNVLTLMSVHPISTIVMPMLIALIQKADSAAHAKLDLE